MNNLLDFLDNNPWLNLTFLILAILGIIATLIIYLKSRKLKKPAYDKINTNIISNQLSNIEGLSVSFNDTIIDDFSVCQIAIYNLGKKSIRRTDIADKDKIRIVLTNGEILSEKLIFTSKDVNNFNILLSIDKKSILIDFDFLGYFDGGVIQFYHTEVYNKNIKVEGTIIDVGKITYTNDYSFILNYGTSLLAWINKNKFTYILKSFITFPYLIILLIIGLYELLRFKVNKFPKEYDLKK